MHKKNLAPEVLQEKRTHEEKDEKDNKTTYVMVQKGATYISKGSTVAINIPKAENGGPSVVVTEHNS